MKRDQLRFFRSRDGATVPIVAVSMVMLIGCAAIAIDIGMLFDSRAEAQRAADAAALAGASALLEGYQEDAPQSVMQDTAIARALHWAGLNAIRGVPVEPGEVQVEFLDGYTRIAATVTRTEIPPLFAGIFGFTSLRVTATAHAMWYQGGGGTCLKPFGVPDTASLTKADVGREVLIWRKNAQEFFPLFRQFSTGSNVRDAIMDLVCDTRVVQVGDMLEHNESSNNTAVSQGQVGQGVDYLFDLDPGLQYNPGVYGEQYDGFNREDWETSPRVMNLILYDPLRSTNTRFYVSGFMRVFLPRRVQNAPQGERLLYGIVLPHKAAAGGGPCSPPNCSALSFNIRLVQ